MDHDVIEAMLALDRSGGTGCLATVVKVQGSAPQRVGSRLLLRPDGSFAGTVGGGAIEARVLVDAKALLAAGHESGTVEYDLAKELGMCCGGSMAVLLERVAPVERLIVFGGGHVASPTARVAAMLGFRVTVVDERPEWANRERFPDAAEVVNEQFRDFLDRAVLTGRDYLLIVTRGHEHDQAILERVAGAPVRWLGMIGSQRKVALALKRLEAKGVDAGAISRVCAPVGVDIGAVTPEEIAVSVAAELVRARRCHAGERWRRDPAVYARSPAAGGTGQVSP